VTSSWSFYSSTITMMHGPLNIRLTSSQQSCLSVRPSVLPRGTTRLPLYGVSRNSILENFSKTKIMENIRFPLKSNKNNGTLHEGQCMFMIISHSLLFRMRNSSDKSCIENQNTHFIYSTLFFFSEIVPFVR